MIPSDVASALRQILPDQISQANAQTKPVIAAQKLADVLSNLVPGQRVLAEIQALLPNGTYRAIVAQRDITLALPFSAKAGDSLELEVTETDGKLALTLVGPGKSEDAAAALKNESVATTLSQAGKLIGNLQGDIAEPGKRAAPAALNGNQPLVETFPDQAASLAPVLKEALVKSGVFYEAHQARWVAGNLSTENLRQEPQGRLSPPAIPLVISQPNPLTVAISNDANTAQTAKQPLNPAQASPTLNATVDEAIEAKMGEQTRSADSLVPSTITTRTEQNSQQSATLRDLPSSPTTQATPSGAVPRDLVPIVQQQLDALATQNYAWQGQIWPGQQMRWEIGNNSDGHHASADEMNARWETRLNVNLPSLGGIGAVIRLATNGDMKISMKTDSESGEARLREAAGALSEQMATAGLKLTQLMIERDDIAS